MGLKEGSMQRLSYLHPLNAGRSDDQAQSKCWAVPAADCNHSKACHKRHTACKWLICLR